MLQSRAVSGLIRGRENPNAGWTPANACRPLSLMAADFGAFLLLRRQRARAL
jgi:hypothetical protein